jgi:hypothetical protein
MLSDSTSTSDDKNNNSVSKDSFIPITQQDTSVIYNSPSLSRFSDESSQSVLFSPLPQIPGTKVIKYLGPINLYFIKEAWAVRSEGKNIL